MTTQNISIDQLVDSHGAAELCPGLSPATIQDYAYRGICPSKKVGHAVLFWIPELRSWYEARLAARTARGEALAARKAGR